jgi:hypothetical protein
MKDCIDFRPIFAQKEQELREKLVKKIRELQPDYIETADTPIEDLLRLRKRLEYGKRKGHVTR